MKKREFIKYAGLLAGAVVAGNTKAPGDSFSPSFLIRKKGSGMKLTFKPYDLQLRHVFTIATNSRTTTPVVLTQIEFDGIKG